MAGYHFILVRPDGEPADPGVFITNEPPGLWKVGDEFIARGLEWFRITTFSRRRTTATGTVGGRDYRAVWTVEPV